MEDLILFVEPLIPSLRRYARSCLCDHAAGDDVVHSCLERVVSRWHQRRTDDDARSWVFSILHDLMVTRLVQQARAGRHVELGDADDALIAAPSEQDDGLRHRDLRRGLAALSEEQRSVLMLISVEDLSYAETAKVLKVSAAAVMYRLAQARTKLAIIMEGETIGPFRVLSQSNLRSVHVPPVMEGDLQAYVDEALEPHRGTEIENYLQENLSAALQVLDYIRLCEELRAAFASVAKEPIPLLLDLARLVARIQHPSRLASWR